MGGWGGRSTGRGGLGGGREGGREGVLNEIDNIFRVRRVPIISGLGMVRCKVVWFMCACGLPTIKGSVYDFERSGRIQHTHIYTVVQHRL